MRSQNGARLFRSEAVALGVIISVAALIPGLYSLCFIAFGFLYAFYGALLLKNKGLLSFENLSLLVASFLLPWCAFELLFSAIVTGSFGQSPLLTVLFFLSLSTALPIVVLGVLSFQKAVEPSPQNTPFSPHIVLIEGSCSYLFGGALTFAVLFPAALFLSVTGRTPAIASETSRALTASQQRQYIYPGDRYHISLRSKDPREVTVSLLSDAKISKTNLLPHESQSAWTVITDPEGGIRNLEGDIKKSALSFITTQAGKQTLDSHHGYLVSGDDIASFLYTRLSMLGLDSKEFTPIVREWSLKLFQYEFVQVTFDYTPLIDETIQIEPAPLTSYQLSILFQPRYSRVELTPQELPVVKSSEYTAIVLRASKVSTRDSFAF